MDYLEIPSEWTPSVRMPTFLSVVSATKRQTEKKERNKKKKKRKRRKSPRNVTNSRGEEIMFRSGEFTFSTCRGWNPRVNPSASRRDIGLQPKPYSLYAGRKKEEWDEAGRCSAWNQSAYSPLPAVENGLERARVRKHRAEGTSDIGDAFLCNFLTWQPRANWTFSWPFSKKKEEQKKTDSKVLSNAFVAESVRIGWKLFRLNFMKY